MSSMLTFVEIDGQHVEMLPARTVLSTVCGKGGTDVYGGDAKPHAEGGSNEANHVKGIVIQSADTEVKGTGGDAVSAKA